MSYISRLAPDFRADRSQLDGDLRALSEESMFFVACNRAIRSAKAFHARTVRIRGDFHQLRSEFTLGVLTDGLGTEAQLEDAIERCAAVEDSIASDWETQRRHLAALGEKLHEPGGMRRMMLTRVTNAMNRAYLEAVTLLRDCRMLCVAALAAFDEPEADVIQTPEELRDYFDRIAAAP